jgi:hypothetical protein
MDVEEDPDTGLDPLPDWRIPYLECLVRGVLPPDRTKARRLACPAKSYVLLDWELYKWSPIRILQRYIPIEQGRWLLQDIHGGICGHHVAPCALVRNVFWQGFY